MMARQHGTVRTYLQQVHVVPICGHAQGVELHLGVRLQLCYEVHMHLVVVPATSARLSAQEARMPGPGAAGRPTRSKLPSSAAHSGRRTCKPSSNRRVVRLRESEVRRHLLVQHCSKALNKHEKSGQPG